jgi:hypothetical protein
MWYKLRMSPEGDGEFVRSTTELFQSTSRYIILTTCGVYLAWHILATVTWPDKFGWRAWLIAPVVALTVVLSPVAPKAVVARAGGLANWVRSFHHAGCVRVPLAGNGLYLRAAPPHGRRHRGLAGWPACRGIGDRPRVVAFP